MFDANSFQKTGVPFLIENTKIGNVSFPQNTALSEANLKTNRTGCIKCTSHNKTDFCQ